MATFLGTHQFTGQDGGGIFGPEYNLDTGDDFFVWWDENDSLFGGNSEAGGIIHGLTGDDYIIGDNGSDALFGDWGEDWLYGNIIGGEDSPGRDYLFGGDDNDHLYGYGGRDFLHGDNGNDYLWGGKGDDELYGDNGSDYLDGGEGNDKLFGGPDFQYDDLHGGPGDDILDGGPGGDDLDGGDGLNDGASYLNSPTGVYADLTFWFANTGDYAANDRYSGIESLGGSNFDDHLGGDNNSNGIRGSWGNDTVYGYGGNDVLSGEGGNDNLFGGDGGDVLDGGEHEDTANYQDAPAGVIADLIWGGSGGFANGDSYQSIEDLIGSQYDDGLGGNDVRNIILGGGGADFIGGRGGNDSLWGETGDDTLGGDAGADDLHGGAGIDTAIYWYAPSRVLADLLFPGLNTREANDANGDTYDQIENLGGSQFDDHLGGDDLANIIFGLNGNDLIAGRGGADQLYGEIGNDTLIGDAGNDTLVGGADTDTAVFTGPRSAYTLTNLGGGNVRVSGPDGVDALTGIERLQFGDVTLAVPTTLFDPLGFKVAGFGPGAGGWTNQDRYPRDVADVNGDGFGDIVGFGDAGVFVSLGSASGFGAIGHRLAAFGLINGGWSSSDRYPRHLADVNGDGMADIVGFGDAGVFVSLATGGGSFGPSEHRLAAFGAVNGGWFSDDRYHRELADVNGDHMADIVGFGDAGVFVSLATGGGTFGPATHRLAAFGTINGGWSSQNTYPRHLADVNGDGKADIVGFGDAGVYVALATGGGNFGPISFGLAGFGRNNGWYSDNVYPRELADVNGDGKADIVGFGDAGAWVGVANGDGSFQPIVLQLQAFGQAGGWLSDNVYPRVLADINHDHVADIVGFGQAGVYASASSAFFVL